MLEKGISRGDNHDSKESSSGDIPFTKETVGSTSGLLESAHGSKVEFNANLEGGSWDMKKEFLKSTPRH